jgi:hypothetical protein
LSFLQFCLDHLCNSEVFQKLHAFGQIKMFRLVKENRYRKNKTNQFVNVSSAFTIQVVFLNCFYILSIK